jgi:hypothetical protein
MESQLSDDEVWLHQTIVMAQKGHNFWSDRWIAQKLLQEFQKPIFLVVAMELLLGDEEVLSARLE